MHDGDVRRSILMPHATFALAEKGPSANQQEHLARTLELLTKSGQVWPAHRIAGVPQAAMAAIINLSSVACCLSRGLSFHTLPVSQWVSL
jgi:predicted transcriptional regulator